MLVDPKKKRLETIGAGLLLLGALLALLFSNTSFALHYFNIIEAPILLTIGYWQFDGTVVSVVNNGLMALFFLAVGIEIKHEIVEGALNSRKKAMLPVIAAGFGMAVPALVYVAFNYQDPVALKAWAVPAATDIAFAIGVLSLLRGRIDPAIRIILVAIAILDDLAAIIIIALFYTQNLSVLALGMAAFCLAVLFILNRFKVVSFTPYLLISLILWVCLMQSGVHATLAGVALALAYPMRHPTKPQFSPTHVLEKALSPWVLLLILPFFAFANAGVPFTCLTCDVNLNLSPLLGVFFGLVVGKQLGVLGGCWLAVKSGLANLPTTIKWRDLYAIATLCGIGFTVSIFIGALAFTPEEVEYFNLVKMGVLFASLFSGVWGYLVLRITSSKPTHQVKSNLISEA